MTRLVLSWTERETMGAMGGPQRRDGKGAAKDAGRRASSSSTMKPEQLARGNRERVTGAKLPTHLRVDVANLDPPTSPHLISTSPIEKHVVVDDPGRPRRNSPSSFLQPDQFMSELRVRTGVELKVETGNRSSLPVSDSPTSARSIRASSDSTPRNDAAVWEPPSPRVRKSPPNGTSVAAEREAQLRGSQCIVSQAQSQFEFEVFYDSLPTLESAESPWTELPKLELSYEGRPAPAPAHLRARTGSTLSLSEKQLLRAVTDPESAQPSSVDHPEDSASELQKSSSSSSQGSARFVKGHATLGNSSAHSNVREKLRSASESRKSQESVPQGEGIIPSRSNTSASAHSQPHQPSKMVVEEAKDGKPAGLLQRMLHWGASKLGKRSSKGASQGSKTGDRPKLSEQQTASKAELKAEVVKIKRESKEVTDLGVERLDPTDGECSSRSSVSSVSTTYSDVSSKSHSYKQSHHKKHVKSEKSKLWLLRVHQKLQGRPGSKESEDESDGHVSPAARGATLHGNTVDANPKSVDKKMLTGSARFNSREKGAMISKLVGKHRRNSTWDAGKLSPTEHLFSPKQKLPKRDAHGLLTPPRRLTGDTDLQRRRQRLASFNLESTTDNKSSLPSPRKVRPVNSRVAPDHQAAGEDSSRRRHGVANRAVPLPKAPATGTFLQTAALILASPGSKDEPNQQLFESSRKGTPAPNAESHCTPPISPTGVSRSTSFGGSFRGFNSPLPLPIRVGTQGSPTSPVYRAGSPRNHSFSKSPEGASSTPTSPGLFAPSPGWPGMQSSASSPGLFAGLDAKDSSSRTLSHARSHGSIAGEQLWVEDISFTNLVKPHPVDRTGPRVWSRSDATIPLGSRNGVVTGNPKPRESKISMSDERDHHSLESNKTQSKPGSVSGVGISFEQIVAGRLRSPPTDNTLMKFFFKCREIEHLNKFLALQKKRFLESFNTDSEKCFHMILSEAGQGLSSMISTLCTAWLLENTMASASVKWHPIPVMNMYQKEMWEHRDAAWLFHVCGIEANALLFLDEVSLTPETVVAGRMKRAVTGQDILQTKDEVASSCTIVSEKFRQEAPKLLQARYMKTLLLAGILVDTKNLSAGSSRDKQQATILLVGAGSLGRNGFYNHLVNTRDENYVTTFIKEIYGDSNALTAEQPGPRGPGVELQSKPMSRPTSMITPEEPPKPTLIQASCNSEPAELKLRTRTCKATPETTVQLNRNLSEPAVKPKAGPKVPSNSKRGWFRNRPGNAH